MRRRKPYAADANEKVALLEQKLNEAPEQQTAMSEILGVISNSPTDLAQCSVLSLPMRRGSVRATSRLYGVTTANF